jgi:hypothetical protein
MRRHRHDRRENGQSLVEFSLVLIPFLVLLMGVFDLGRAIYTMNGTAEAARGIARVTSVHPWDSSGVLGSSDETADVIATQTKLVPGLDIAITSDIACVDALDSVVDDDECWANEEDRWVRVYVSAPFSPITPLVAAFGAHEFESTSRIAIP